MKSSRRDFFQKLGVGAAGLSMASSLALESCAASSETKKADDGQELFIGDNIAVADTSNGKIRGFIHKDIYNFLGIPYGASTEGKNRFMPPQKPAPWTDVYPAVYWPNAAPQLLVNFYGDRYLAFTDYWHYDEISENCLGINVWTPGTDSNKRPVLLWIHGGGFTSGNSIEHPQYHGENLSRRGDIVFCSLNHRLGPLGFANFAGVGGEKFAASGNVGMLDIVAALEWIRDNIASFGGDPGNVTIMGQSGGGRKVCMLTAMPSAKGLFHKAVSLSGQSLSGVNQETSEKLGAYVLKEAGVSSNQIDKLQDLPWKDYYAIANKASAKLRAETPGAPAGGGGGMGGFSPAADGIHLSKEPFFTGDLSPNIPMIISSTFYERSPSKFDSTLEDVSLDRVKEELKATFGDKTSEIVDAYSKAYPSRKPVEIWGMLNNTYRVQSVAAADAKSSQPAPVFNAWFGWNTPLFDGRLRAFHTMDIGFWFYNTDVHISHTGGGARPRELSAKMADTLVQFMKSGNANGGGLPEWPRYTKENKEVMVLDDAPEVKNNPDGEARKVIST